MARLEWDKGEQLLNGKTFNVAITGVRKGGVTHHHCFPGKENYKSPRIPNVENFINYSLGKVIPGK